jgi:hypothetical protein
LTPSQISATISRSPSPVGSYLSADIPEPEQFTFPDIEVAILPLAPTNFLQPNRPVIEAAHRYFSLDNFEAVPLGYIYHLKDSLGNIFIIIQHPEIDGYPPTGVITPYGLITVSPPLSDISLVNRYLVSLASQAVSPVKGVPPYLVSQTVQYNPGLNRWKFIIKDILNLFLPVIEFGKGLIAGSQIITVDAIHNIIWDPKPVYILAVPGSIVPSLASSRFPLRRPDHPLPIHKRSRGLQSRIAKPASSAKPSKDPKRSKQIVPEKASAKEPEIVEDVEPKSTRGERDYEY